ncbi:hypothetical protein ABZ352_35645 [Streptomyces griseofuscus]|uniref:hypothetical protein n=1 Tax=Streptomyces griseofuscus TaxID=146922 RepID=UPI0033D0C0DE
MKQSTMAYRGGLVALVLPFPVLLLTVGAGTWHAALLTFGVPAVLQAAVLIWARPTP